MSIAPPSAALFDTNSQFVTFNTKFGSIIVEKTKNPMPGEEFSWKREFTMAYCESPRVPLFSTSKNVLPLPFSSIAPTSHLFCINVVLSRLRISPSTITAAVQFSWLVKWLSTILAFE